MTCWCTRADRGIFDTKGIDGNFQLIAQLLQIYGNRLLENQQDSYGFGGEGMGPEQPGPSPVKIEYLFICHAIHFW